LFEVINRGGVAALGFRPWFERGIEHGFTLKPADFSAQAGEGWRGALVQAHGVQGLRTLNQVHGSGIVVTRGGAAGDGTEEPEGDAFIIEQAPPTRLIWGIKTADCAPILVVAGRHRALIHAGWRGLARGIIAAVLERLPADERVECIIGPCAGPEGYEVGREVINALGPAARVVSPSSEAVYLDVAATAHALIGVARPNASVWRTSLNTVIEPCWHSFRRDRTAAGRSLGFFVV
jgi:copper oxidase (laccase) domain-containing protein